MDAKPVEGELVDNPKPRSLASTVMIAVGVIALLYLLNPTFGMFELIPDNAPIVGNLDEAAATTLLLGSLAYFGFEIPWPRKKRRE